jgi:hypothetical protein
MPLVAQAMSGLDLHRLDLEIHSLGEDGVGAPWAVGMLNHPAILPDPGAVPGANTGANRANGYWPVRTTPNYAPQVG